MMKILVKTLFAGLLFQFLCGPAALSQVSQHTRICRTGLNKVLGALVQVYDTIFVNIPNAITVTDVNVTLDTIIHTWDAGVQMALYHLSARDSLVTHRGGSGDNFMHTQLNDSASIPISAGVPPFTGSYRPEQPLQVFTNSSPNGAWVLWIYNDQGGGDTGILRSWCIDIQYLATTGLSNNGNSIPSSFCLYQNYPNPFNPVTKIQFSIPLEGAQYIEPVQLKVFDILGREIQTLVNEQLSPGTYEINFDGTKYPSGVYYYALRVRQAGSSTIDFKDTKKMVLIK